LTRPDLRVRLIEPMLRRSTFLSEVVNELALDNVTVVRALAQEFAGTGAGSDVVTARAVAPLRRLVGWCLPLLRPGGQLLALKGESAASELVAAKAEIQRAGGTSAEILTVGDGVVDPPTTVVRVTRSEERRQRR